MPWQTIAALVLVAAAAGWALKLLVGPFFARQPAGKDEKCAGSCGCGNERK